MAERRFLILHGLDNWRPRKHWQWWLADRLRMQGEQVLYPQLPSPASPGLDEWLAVLHGELAQMGRGERIVIAHSCSVALWLLAAPGITASERVDRVALVSPPGLCAFPARNRAFLPVGIDWAAVASASNHPPIVVSSDNDPFVPGGMEEYARMYTEALGLEHHIVPGAGHISLRDGYGPWPAMLEWCLLAEEATSGAHGARLPFGAGRSA